MYELRFHTFDQTYRATTTKFMPWWDYEVHHNEMKVTIVVFI